jgi:HSP20 family protein
MANIIPADELRKLQKRMDRLLDDLGLTDLESRYLEELQRMQKRMSDLMEGAETDIQGDILTPLADVRETDEAIIVTMDLPGVDKNEVDITIRGDELFVAAEKKTESEVKEKNYHRRERSYRRFERSVRLPASVKMEEAKARLAEGVLEITLPKEVVAIRKRISID